MDGSVLEEKSSFKMQGLTFSSKLDWGSYIISVAKTVSTKIGALIRSIKFLSPVVALYLCKSTVRPSMKYCCHGWAGAPSRYLELLDKLQKRICRAKGSSLFVSLEPLAHRRFGRCSSELAKLFSLPYSWSRSVRYSDDYMIFLLPFLDVTRISMYTVSFLAQLDNLLSFDLRS